MAALVLSTVSLAGCVQGVACPSWAGYDTPEDAADAATAVISGRVVERARTVPMFGTDANVWVVEVDEWIKGDGPGRIDVTSIPSGCGAGPAYFGRDPFDEATEFDVAIVFLSGDADEWQGLSPVQGIAPAAPGGGVPSAWPDAP